MDILGDFTIPLAEVVGCYVKFHMNVPCGRLIYSKRKLKPEKTQLQQVLEDMSFSCGAQLQELAALKDIVFVWEMSCGQPIEKLHYAARFDDICVYCAEVVSPWSNTEQYYQQCSAMTVQRNPQSKMKNSRKRMY